MEDTIQANVGSTELAGSTGMTSHSTPHSSGSMTEKRKRASAKKYKAFDDAKKFAHGLNLKSRKEWRDYVKGKKPQMVAKPEDVPAHPDGIYKTKGWQGWRNWLGTEKPSKETLN